MERSYPNFVGRISLYDGKVTDLATGEVYEFREWEAYKQGVLLEYHQANCDTRDKTSDLVNAPGVKTWFHDDWFRVVRPTRRPPPWEPAFQNL